MIKIKRWDTEDVIYSGNYKSVKECLEAGVSRGIDFSFADLTEANLTEADLNEANLFKANLFKAKFADTYEIKDSHHKVGSMPDTLQWAEARYSNEQLQAIAEFMQHKYLNRLKGQDKEDNRKLIEYAKWGSKFYKDY